jgi:hypothetical protein
MKFKEVQALQVELGFELGFELRCIQSSGSIARLAVGGCGEIVVGIGVGSL